MGCRDPANTANWVEIITGKLWERNIQDGASRTLTPSLGDVATGVGRWYGIDMMCASDPNGSCYWIPAVDLRGGDGDYSAGRRR